jgi:hypothetical protein
MGNRTGARRLGVGAHTEVAVLQVGSGQQLGGGRLGLDPARHHEELALGHRGGGAQLLLDDQHGGALGDQPVHGVHQDVDDRGCQPLGRLVHQHQRAVEQQRPADRQHLLLTAGQVGAAAAPALGQPGNSS